ncbi:Regulation of nuclear pre-mRNA domain-containing protein 2 [Bienertia sinuspersici]
MASAEEELEKRSKFLSSLIQKKKSVDQQQQQQHDLLNVRIRNSDMPISLQNKAFQCARAHLDSMPSKRVDSKRLALALKKGHVPHW